jgi:hypothetical protein
MKYVIKIHENDRRDILNMYGLVYESNPIRLGCHDMDMVKKYCESLSLKKEDLDKIISQNRVKLISDLGVEIDKFIKQLITMGGNDSKIIADKFSTSIQKLKPSIIKVISQYYEQSVYASGNLSKPVDIFPILSSVVKMIYDEFIKIWNNNWMEKQTAKLFVTKKNIDDIKMNAKNIWYDIVNKFYDIVDNIYSIWAYNPVMNLIELKNKSTEKCTSVVLTHDKGCNKLTTPIYPNKTYVSGYPTVNATIGSEQINTISKQYLPIINKLLDELV